MKFKRGHFKGKKIEFAPTNRIESTQEIADEFMFEIFNFEAGEYLLTDESSICDFTEIGSSDTTPIWNKITNQYGINREQVQSDKLVDIFDTIMFMRNPH